MFNYSVQYVYKKISGLSGNEQRSPAAIITYSSDDVLFSPFMISLDNNAQTAALTPNEIINFANGVFNQMEIIRNNWSDLETRAMNIIARLQTELSNGLTSIDYNQKPLNKSESSSDGSTWS